MKQALKHIGSLQHTGSLTDSTKRSRGREGCYHPFFGLLLAMLVLAAVPAGLSDGAQTQTTATVQASASIGASSDGSGDNDSSDKGGSSVDVSASASSDADTGSDGGSDDSFTSSSGSADSSVSSEADTGADDASSGSADAENTMSAGSDGGSPAEDARASLRARTRDQIRMRIVAQNEKLDAMDARDRMRVQVQALVEARKAIAARAEALDQHREDYEQSRARYQATLAEARECNGTACAQARADVLVQAKDVLTSAADRILALLAKTAERVEASDFDADVKADILAQIELDTADINALVVQIDAAQTRQEIIRLSKELRVKLVSAQRNAQHHLQRRAVVLMGRVQEGFAQIEDSLDAQIQALAQAGVDTTALSAKLQVYAQLVADSQVSFASAKSLVAQAQDATGDAKVALLQQAQDAVQASNDVLKQAHASLKELREDVRTAQLGVGADGGAEAQATA